MNGLFGINRGCFIGIFNIFLCIGNNLFLGNRIDSDNLN